MGELNWVYTALTLLVVSLVFYAIRLANPRKIFHEFAWGAMLLSMLCLVVSLVIRSKTAQYFALSNMYESMLVVCIGMQLAFLCFDRWFKVRALGFPAALLLLGAILYDLTLPTDIKPLQPALQSYWRSIHVPIILLSYALFTLAFLSSVVYLLKYYWVDRKTEAGHSVAARGSAGGNLDGSLDRLAPLASSTPQLAMAAAGASPVSSIKPLHAPLSIDGTIAYDQQHEHSNIYDELTYRCVAFGFPLLAVGIILGGIWANEAWGNYWSWDPKESMSLVTLLGYGVYLHMRVNQAHHTRVLAWVSVIGFILMLITYFGVNLMGLGLHSYGKIG
ncbi:MAG: c-type cytochrome biogenesis protein CcsB [Vampirovibrionales bacterium]|nr:c-type cytochrome biogenesis protein CcsB [Vampirovibrionales bacterium]